MSNKVLLTLILLNSLLIHPLFAFDAKVKKGDVTVLINNKSQSFAVGESFNLSSGDIICFSEGAGRVVIRATDKDGADNKSYKKQLSKHSKSCKHLPNKNGKATDYAKGVKEGIVSLFQTSTDKSVDGVSRANKTVDTLVSPLSIDQSAHYLAIENSSWGPLPITLEILDDDNKVLETMENEDDIHTSFIIPTSLLKEGYTIKVLNGLDDVFVKSNIHFQK